MHASATASLMSSISSIEKFKRLATAATESRASATHSALHGMRRSTTSTSSVCRQRLIHTSAFIAASSLSKMPKILTRPVMSKIFLICGFVQTRFTEPPCSRTRLRPPIKHAQAGRIDVAHLFEIDDEVIDASIDQVADRVLDFRRRVDVDLAAQVDDVAITLRFAHVYLDVQRRPLHLLLVGRVTHGGACILDNRATALVEIGSTVLPLRGHVPELST